MRPHHIWLSLGVFLFALAIYLPRTAVTVQDSDGADFAVAAALGGVPHPPGYPVYTLLTRPLAAFYPSNPYHALAIFSAVSQAAAAALLTLITTAALNSTILGLALVIPWALHESTLRAATDAEVFAFHNLLVCGIVFLTLRALATAQASGLLALSGGLLVGFVCAHHQIVILWLPLLLCLLCEKYRTKAASSVPSPAPRSFFTFAAIGFAVGLSPYLLLPLWYQENPAASFAAIRTPQEFIGYLLRMGYGTFSPKLGAHAGDINYSLHFLSVAFPALPLHFIAAAVLCVLTVMRPRLWYIALCAVLAAHAWFLTQLVFPGPSDQYGDWVQRFYSPLTLYLTVVSALVLAELAVPRWPVAVLVILFTLPHVPSALSAGNARDDRVVAVELNSILETLPEGSMFIAHTDRIGLGLRYRQLVLSERQDLAIVQAGLLPSRFYRERIAKQFAFLEGHELASVAKVAEAAQDYGRAVYVHTLAPLPPEWHAVWLGTVKQLFREMPEAQPLGQRLRNFCRTWPEALWQIPKERAHSKWIAHEVFFNPVRQGALLQRTLQGDDLFWDSLVRGLARKKFNAVVLHCRHAVHAAPRQSGVYP